MTEHAVVIAGGGPTGLMLAGELALAKVDVVIVERRANQELNGSRAKGLSSRTLEMLDQRGVADRFIAAGQKAQVTGFAVTRLDISDFPTRHNYGLGLGQEHIELGAGLVGAGLVDEAGMQGGLAQAPGTTFCGIRPWPVPPIRIALTTRCWLTVPISSRFGPVTPCAPAAFSVWQLQQFSRKSILPSLKSWLPCFDASGPCDPSAECRFASTSAGTAIPRPT